MGCISPNIKENVKVTVLGTAIEERIVHLFARNMWKAKRLSTTILQAATGTNRWIKHKFRCQPRSRNGDLGGEPVNEPETDILSESEKEEEEVGVNNQNEILWTDSVVTIDPRRVYRSYSNVPVHISDIEYATSRQFFERFLPVEYIMSTVLSSTNEHARASERHWKNITWMDMSHQRFRDIVKFMTLTDAPMDDNDTFYFARKFHNKFNDNLSEVVTPRGFLRIDESVSQWMGKIEKDPIEPPEHASKKKLNHGLIVAGQLLQIHGLVVRVRKLDDVDLTLCSIHDRKNIVLIASCSMTNLGTEVTRYIKGHGSVKFHRPAVFDEYNEYWSTEIYSTIYVTMHFHTMMFSQQNHFVISIFNYYSNEKMEETVAGRIKKRREEGSNNIEHNLISIKNDPSTLLLKGKRIQRHCISCHKCTTTSCSCLLPQAICSNCWTNHIYNIYNTVRTR
ncbi:hypothetical protein Glove_219g45 [Diversispora epigaea]|uniref:PiggyBac transposable element-derived protein domain-containing protein n=1 Tax=Diversispora epigaea TaxID=1348612 RepID=A0A397INV8_9GLOM|nr:hypothetical protein Glove_219g45 [Diversispora epigaea]